MRWCCLWAQLHLSYKKMNFWKIRVIKSEKFQFNREKLDKSLLYHKNIQLPYRFIVTQAKGNVNTVAWYISRASVLMSSRFNVMYIYWDVLYMNAYKLLQTSNKSHSYSRFNYFKTAIAITWHLIKWFWRRKMTPLIIWGYYFSVHRTNR